MRLRPGDKPAVKRQSGGAKKRKDRAMDERGDFPCYFPVISLFRDRLKIGAGLITA
jgi:hypothetical protein